MWWCTTTRWYRQHAWEWHHWSVWTTRYDWTMWWVSVVIGRISGGWSHRFYMSFIIIINSSVSINSNQVLISLGNSGLCWTVFARNRDTAVPAEGNGYLQTLICVLVVWPRRCLTLSNPVPWQNWMAAYLGYTLRMRTLFRGWTIMVNDTHTRRRSVAA